VIDARRFLAVLRKEALHIVRDPRALIVALILPLFQLLLYSYVLTFDVTHIPTAVVDMDHTAESRSYLTAFKSSTYFDLMPYQSYVGVDRALTRNAVKVGIVVPSGFGRTLAGGGRTAVQILVDGSDPRIAAVGQGYAQAISSQFSQKLRLAGMSARGIIITKGFPPLTTDRRVWYNPELKSLNFIVPGLIAVIMSSITAVQIAGALVVEKERRTLENLLISPLRPRELILGKVVPYIGLAAMQAGIITVMAIWGLGVPFRGSVLIFVVATLLFLATMLGIGLWVSSVAETQQTAQFFSFLLAMLPAFMLSGFIFPVASMPAPIRAFTYLVPARYFLVVLRGVFLKGAPLSALWQDIAALAVFATGALGMSIVVLRRRLG
jgi:ABC-2 type transport system permease protein